MSQMVRGRSGIEKRRAKYAYLFIAPWVAGLLLFYAYPLFGSIYYSFTNYNVVSETTWVGLANYHELMKDPLFWTGIQNTLIYAAFEVPLSVVVGVLLALLLNLEIKGRGIFRTVFFLPTLVPVVATSIIWEWLLNPQFGLVNSNLELLGIKGPGWLGDPTWSKPSLILMSVWGIGNAMIIYLAGLQDISKDYYEAAEIDGAGAVNKAWRITLPLLTPVIFFNVVMGIINALQVFTLPYAVTYGTGKPADSLLFYSMYLYNNAFLYMKMGFASAMAWIMFVIIITITLWVFKSSSKWVYYQGDD
ncbi:carbohydrate ABC transporter permease [Paenibacillus thalictri]|uniref:Sugar ABC transporter permease n=1 Tax=Paenibacillus thalictri TaxID=2527873 RepID=A0A4Q9DPJ8_9BACL|nr:sugar ABC transporter permease [Paenibacillus thalictri]TBL75148.1 sugar ABC transporter permease [Paenibacillus thalictri]